MSKLATVNDFANYFNNLAKEGKGDYTVDVAVDDGRSYSIYDFKIGEVYDSLKKVYINE
jgi:hypothetical protein